MNRRQCLPTTFLVYPGNAGTIVKFRNVMLILALLAQHGRYHNRVGITPIDFGICCRT